MNPDNAEEIIEQETESDSTVRNEWAETFKSMSTTAVVLGATLMVLAVLHPNLILRNNTPTGGDMGAHIWGPAYLRDVLLPHWKLTGWSMDWYAGLPTYRFYMVLPALLIVFVNLILPYGVAFKIIVVLGLVTFPVCVFLMGRVVKLPYPLPELMVVGATMFLFDESFTIYGGNIPSTMAGEFSFSIALTLSVVALGLFARGLDDGKYRPWAAVFIALSALSHGIVLIFVFAGAALMLLMRLDRQRLRYGVTTIGVALILSAFWVVPFLGGHSFMTDMKYEPRPSGATDSLWQMFFPLSTGFDILLVGLSVIGFASSIGRKRFLGVWMGVYSILLMIGVKVAQQSLPIIGLLWNPRLLPFLYLLRYMLAGFGVYEVGIYIKQSIAMHRRPGERPKATGITMGTSMLWVMTLSCLVILGFRYQTLPYAKMVSDASGSKYAWGPIKAPATRAFSDGWARWNFEGYEGKSAYGEYRSIVETMQKLGADPAHGCGHALWENNGELNKYGTTMSLMLLPYWTSGCIGSMEGLFFEAAGTTPYHFITAAALSKQSSNPVRELRYDNNDAVKGVAYMRMLGIRYYMGFTPEAVLKADNETGLTRVGTSGPWHVYEIKDTRTVEPLTFQPVVVNERSGDKRERWLEVGASYFQHTSEWAALPVADGPQVWQHIDVLPDSERVVGTPGDPARQVDIVIPAPPTQIQPRVLDAVTVSDVEINEESVSFSVDKIGVPVLVKVSYFPNWKVSGASKIYRSAPNFMVVIPTSKNVKLSYKASNLDTSSNLLTILGIICVVMMSRRRFRYSVVLPPLASSVEPESDIVEG